MSKIKKYFGPSTLVTAAFIGPGTLTVCSISGASQGYSLLWVLLLATIVTILLQEMAARLGLITQKGLGEAIRSELKNPIVRGVSIFLVFVAIIVGNAAYEAGNISGAVLGMSGTLGPSNAWPLAIGFMAFIILFVGKFQIIERILIGLVLVMSVVFLVTAVVVRPNLSQLLLGFVPTIDASNQLSVLALIGTTVVPYNLFLHASAIRNKWRSTAQLADLRKENTVAISLGGLISMAIVVTSATMLFGTTVSGVGEMSEQLVPLLGSWARYFLAIGLFAAGISSAITAPLAAAYAAKGIFGWDADSSDLRFRIVWAMILFIGVVFSMTGYKPVTIIQAAQIANGVLLPVIVFFLVYISNRRDLLGKYVNKGWQNVLAILVITMSLIISLRSLNSVFGFL